MGKRRTLRLITTLVGGLAVSVINATTALTFTEPTSFGHSIDGAGVYGSKCAICHGKNGSGTPAWRAKGQPDLSTAEWQKTHSDDQIVERIKLGKGEMPPFGKKLSDEQIVALVKHVRNFRK